MVGYPFTKTEHRYNNIFALEYGHPNPATNIARIEHRGSEPECMVNVVL